MDSSRSVQRSRRNQIAAGAALVVIGLVVLALQRFSGPGRAVLLLLAGGAFIAAYLYSDVYGLLIPGGILSGLGLGLVGEWQGLPVKDPNAVGLGIGFVSIYLIEWGYRRRAHWWPLIPGGILTVSGLGVRFGDLARVLRSWAPAVLVAVGVLLVVRAMRRGPGVPPAP